MKFRTEIPIRPSEPYLEYGQSILSLGSCFADEMGGRLAYHKFNIQVNPLGICYNPLSLVKLINWMQGEIELSRPVYQQRRDRWHSFDLHSSFSFTEQATLLQKLEEKQGQLKVYLEEAHVLMLTLGTARAYRLKETGEWVANNYGYPAKDFIKDWIGLDEMEKEMTACLDKLQSFNPKLKIILTVSPIRHIRDGLEENALSKASLIMLVQKLVAKHEQISYFPAYEIMMDDLRDYRFYEADLIHPNEQARSYIWEKFMQAHMKEGTQELLGQISSIQKDLMHKAFQAQSEAHQNFLKKLLTKIDALPKEIDFAKEIKEIQAKLIG